MKVGLLANIIIAFCKMNADADEFSSMTIFYNASQSEGEQWQEKFFLQHPTNMWKTSRATKFL